MAGPSPFVDNFPIGSARRQSSRSAQLANRTHRIQQELAWKIIRLAAIAGPDTI
jgi:hypothetical protein